MKKEFDVVNEKVKSVTEKAERVEKVLGEMTVEVEKLCENIKKFEEEVVKIVLVLIEFVFK